MFVRHTAWLNAAPVGKGDPPGAQRLSRLQLLEDEGREPEMPPLEAGEHVVGYLWEIGPTAAAGMGVGPVTHEAIRAWQDNIGIDLHPWEARFMRLLSLEYVNQYYLSAAPECEAPWLSSNDKARLAAKSLQASLLELSKL